MNHILVITTEPLPVPGGLTTGAGLRAWGLAEGLRSRGFPVTIATPLEGEQAHAQAKNPTDDRVVYFVRAELGDAITRIKPDVIVMQHWGLMYAVPPVDCPLVIDLAGPHLLERLYWGNRDATHDLQEKLAALRRADYIICGGEFQRHYFYPYLAMAGHDVASDQFPVIPFSVPPDAPSGQPEPGAEPTFIYGGAFLAWQNPEKPIRWLLDEMDQAGRGRLLFYGGAHPNMDASGGRFLEIFRLLKEHPRVEMRGWKAFADLTNEYAREGHVALDLMQRNPERELAYTTRTMVYLHCGLPVIYNDYSEISGVIKAHECGWCVDPEDEAAFRGVVRRVFEDTDGVLAMRGRARQAAQAQSWDSSIGPLADFCANPFLRAGKDSAAGLMPPEGELENPTSAAVESPETKTFFPRKGRYAANLAFVPIWLLSRFLRWYLRN